MSLMLVTSASSRGIVRYVFRQRISRFSTRHEFVIDLLIWIFTASGLQHDPAWADRPSSVGLWCDTHDRTGHPRTELLIAKHDKVLTRKLSTTCRLITQKKRPIAANARMIGTVSPQGRGNPQRDSSGERPVEGGRHDP